MSVYGYKYGRVPEELMYSDASDRACRLHAVLTRWSDIKPDEHPTRRELAALLHCSVDSVDRALKELEATGYLKIIPRYAEGVRIASDYVVDGGSRTDAGGSRTGAATVTSANGEPAGDGGRTGAVGGGRTGAAVNKERDRSKRRTEEDHVPPTAADDARKTEAPPRPDVEGLCLFLADRIIANGASEHRYRNRPVTKAWRDPMRRLIDLDGVSPDRVRKAIDWCQADDFWKAVVLSPASLRENYDKLRLAAQRASGQNGNGHHGDRRPPPEIPEVDLASRPPRHDPVAMMAWSDRQLEEATRT